MGEKQKLSKKQREHKESKGSARGARPVKLTPIQKILIANGGIGHARLRRHAPAMNMPRKMQKRED